ncbi:hypothetical protein GcM1_03767 [Golovinomyces cichoracearum]|uniref:Uncharacterized protein n=1 Tax=Golovinomyces cichoracearum TaxID=62708 RepID=A0A420IRQ6_9PEZI|nr:hypothetical protein GcM1_03767 [Golovinomyces cichoracearum]
MFAIRLELITTFCTISYLHISYKLTHNLGEIRRLNLSVSEATIIDDILYSSDSPIFLLSCVASGNKENAELVYAWLTGNDQHIRVWWNRRLPTIREFRTDS